MIPEPQLPAVDLRSWVTLNLEPQTLWDSRAGPVYCMPWTAPWACICHAHTAVSSSLVWMVASLGARSSHTQRRVRGDRQVVDATSDDRGAPPSWTRSPVAEAANAGPWQSRGLVLGLHRGTFIPFCAFS